MSDPTQRGVTFNASALSRAFTGVEVHQFGRENPRPSKTVRTVVALGFLIVFNIVLFASIGTFRGHSSLVGPVTFVAALGIAAALLGLIWHFALDRKRKELGARLARFAADNGMTFVPFTTDPQLPGMIFGQGHGRTASELVRGTHPRFVEFGNYEYTTGSGKSQATHRWGYVAIRLDVPLPNIVLDAVGNNGLFGSNLPLRFREDQVLSLEGDFDKYFTLYCPAGYGPDALYLFTPDIMARFMDHAAQLDAEIVDDWLFFYMKRGASTADPATWAWLFTTVAAMITKLDQWARWRDERLRGMAPPDAAALSAGPAGPVVAAPAGALPTAQPVTSPLAGATASGISPLAAPSAALVTPPPGVAPPGRRLKRRFIWVGPAIALVSVFAYFLLRVWGH